MAERVKASFLQRPESHNLGFNPNPDHAVAFLDKTLFDDYLCLVALNKQQIQWTRIQKIHNNIGSLETLKQVRIPPTTK